MKTKIVGCDEMVSRDVIRPFLELEWLTKVSFCEYNVWAKSAISVLKITGCNEADISERLEAERQNREEVYQRAKKDSRKTNGLKKTKDIKLGGELTGITYQTRYGKVKGINSFDMVSSPSLRNAVLQEFDKPNKNGRIYPRDYKDVVRWDRYEKHVKQYGI